MFVAEPGERSDWLVAVEFHFELGGVVVEAVPDDDTVSVHPAQDAPKHWAGEATCTPSAHPAVGCQVSWAWWLTNHQGYQDGFQIEFVAGPLVVRQQFLVVASRLLEFDVGR
jgi:hypothetical protein